MQELPFRTDRPPVSLTVLTVRGEWPTAVSDLPIILTERQLAHVRGVTVRTLQRDRQRGNSIPFKRIGRRIYYARDDVLSYFGAGKP
jgi:hypothetical protein